MVTLISVDSIICSYFQIKAESFTSVLIRCSLYGLEGLVSGLLGIYIFKFDTINTHLNTHPYFYTSLFFVIALNLFVFFIYPFRFAIF